MAAMALLMTAFMDQKDFWLKLVSIGRFSIIRISKLQPAKRSPATFSSPFQMFLLFLFGTKNIGVTTLFLCLWIISRMYTFPFPICWAPSRRPDHGCKARVGTKQRARRSQGIAPIAAMAKSNRSSKCDENWLLMIHDHDKCDDQVMTTDHNWQLWRMDDEWMTNFAITRTNDDIIYIYILASVSPSQIMRQRAHASNVHGAQRKRAARWRVVARHRFVVPGSGQPSSSKPFNVNQFQVSWFEDVLFRPVSWLENDLFGKIME